MLRALRGGRRKPVASDQSNQRPGIPRAKGSKHGLARFWTHDQHVTSECALRVSARASTRSTPGLTQLLDHLPFHLPLPV